MSPGSNTAIEKMIESFTDGVWKTYEQLSEAMGFFRYPSPIVSVIGAGGKTTVIQRLQQEYYEKKMPAVVTTTTHIQKIKTEYCLTDPQPGEIDRMLQKAMRVWTGTNVGDGKLGALSKECLEDIFALKVPLLIEADGARHLSCKAPEIHEPVILPQSDVVLSVYGLDGIGQPIKEVCFRPHKAAELLKKEEKERLTAADIVTLALHEAGGKKGVLPSMEYQVLLSKADVSGQRKTGRKIAEQLSEQGISRIHVTDIRTDLEKLLSEETECVY